MTSPNNLIITLDKQVDIHIDIYDHTLANKWFAHLENLIDQKYILEKQYCFLGYVNSPRSGEFLCNEINRHIDYINNYFTDYQIDEIYDISKMVTEESVRAANEIDQEPLNRLHRYFEELQGINIQISPYYIQADSSIKYSIKQLNLLCHELESWILSFRKSIRLPEWMRPSQLMCWLNAPRFLLEPDDFNYFGIDSLCKELGGVYMGTNKAVGKTYYEVFCDERGNLGKLTTIAMRPQTVGAGDFDIEWAKTISPKDDFKKTELDEFKNWLLSVNINPEDKTLGIGHPKVAQVDLQKSFGTANHEEILKIMEDHLNVSNIRTNNVSVEYDYTWDDTEFEKMYKDVL